MHRLDRQQVFSDLLTRYRHPSIAIWRSVEICTVAEFLDGNPLDRPILDLGCGEGHVADLLFDAVDVGLEVEAAPLHAARCLELYRHLIVGDAQCLPFAAGSFGTVFSNSVIEHIPGNDRVLAEASRVLRPGGRFVFTVPTNPDFGSNLFGTRFLSACGLGSLAAGYASTRNRRLDHFHTYTESEWRRRLGLVNLDVEHSESYLSRRATTFWDLFAIAVLGLRKLGVWQEYERSWTQTPQVARGIDRVLRCLVGRTLEERGSGGSSLLVSARKPV